MPSYPARRKGRRPFPYVAARGIKLLVLDIDGVMTDGGLYYDASGLCMKRFDVQDGLGVKIAQRQGLKFGIITGMCSPAVAQRVAQLGIDDYHEGILDKISCLDALRQKHNLEWAELAYMGDDWVDIPAMLRVGLRISVPNGRPVARRLADYVTRAEGGHGAVREALEHILQAWGRFADALKEYEGI